ncbi:unnamed protein product [Caenorhabditis angaria]|uniref:Serine aminopeptidase S33 domain-containing protein n=1 Tax=Caenorhabditis angaria TaxID=860376 RepID=A0A9P1IS34_9PELO|nr:unnamed protein product [Caenorhabditis angaria]
MLGYFISILQPVFILIFAFLFFVAVILPILVLLFPHYIQFIFFLNFRRLPNTDYNDISANDVNAVGRSFYIPGKAGKIGVWHMLPRDLSLEYRSKGVHPSDEEMESSLADSKYKIIFYAHGNSFDRTFYHRVELYNVLNNSNYHVICFDYRGYGDSQGTPTEHGIIQDAHTVYSYLKSHSKNNTVIVWGHSMGTGVSCKLVKDLCLAEKPPNGLVLESPFNNLRDAITNHPIFLIFKWMNDFLVDNVIIKPLNSVGLRMESDQRITHISCPILILHAQDDRVLPVKLGRALYKAAKKSDRKVEFREFDSVHNFGHKFICRSPELPEIISQFTKSLEIK